MSYSISFSDYSNKLIDGKPSIWLQDFGWATAKPAIDFRAGDFMRWNTGSCSKVIGVAKETEKTIVYTIEWIDYHGKPAQGERKFLKTRWVAVGDSF